MSTDNTISATLMLVGIGILIVEIVSMLIALRLQYQRQAETECFVVLLWWCAVALSPKLRRACATAVVDHAYALGRSHSKVSVWNLPRVWQEGTRTAARVEELQTLLTELTDYDQRHLR